MTWSTFVKVGSSSTSEPIWTRNESERYEALDEPELTELSEVGRGALEGSVKLGGRPESVDPVSESRDNDPERCTSKAHDFDGVEDAWGDSYLITICSWLIGPRIGGGGAGVRVSILSLKLIRLAHSRSWDQSSYTNTHAQEHTKT